MFVRFAYLLLLANLYLNAQAALGTSRYEMLHHKRSAPDDLELGGELTGFFDDVTRYVSYADLLSLPQETQIITNDSNFFGPTQITGVSLENLLQAFGRSPKTDLIAAICSDEYRSHYPQDYISSHHPILVLKINGQLHDKWPPSARGGSLGFYLISNPHFTPSFRILSHADEAQTPYAITRIEFKKEEKLLSALRPPGKWSPDSTVMQGYRIAQQNCLRCHNVSVEGGLKADLSWYRLAAYASNDAENFKLYIHNPRAISPGTKMPAMPQYDDATLTALTEYYATFLVVSARTTTTHSGTGN
jgi:mono/diheme cytochrome c family protein